MYCGRQTIIFGYFRLKYNSFPVLFSTGNLFLSIVILRQMVGYFTVWRCLTYSSAGIRPLSDPHPAASGWRCDHKMDDGTIREDFNELYRLMNRMELWEMDKIIYPVCTLCRDHQRSGFVEWIKVGIRLMQDLTEQYKNGIQDDRNSFFIR